LRPVLGACGAPDWNDFQLEAERGDNSAQGLDAETPSGVAEIADVGGGDLCFLG
jgi:hypothetical protein